jgi:cell division septum initiation protein DivIVA
MSALKVKKNKSMTPEEIKNVVKELNEIRDIANADVEKVVGYNTRLQSELDEARAELAQLKDTVAAYEAATVKESLTVRPEPSRLEIAAMLLCHEWCLGAEMALEEADLLIAKAKRNETTA